jgi:hypothetical protein
VSMERAPRWELDRHRHGASRGGSTCDRLSIEARAF